MLEPGETFGIAVRTMTGEVGIAKGLQSDSPLMLLVERAAEALAIPQSEMRLCEGPRLFQSGELRQTLRDLGLSQDTELLAVRQSNGDGQPSEYRILQGPLFKKPGEDPTTSRVVKISRKVGSTVHATGRTWTGPQGGEWIELNPFQEKHGWLIMEGSTYNQPGPLLEKVHPGEEKPKVLRVTSPFDESHSCQICLRPNDTIGDAKVWMCLRFPGAKHDKIQVARECTNVNLRNAPGNLFMENSERIADAPFEDGDELMYFYMENPNV